MVVELDYSCEQAAMDGPPWLLSINFRIQTLFKGGIRK